MVPTLLQSILATAPTERPAALAHLRFIRTPSSALPASLRAKAEAYFGVPVLKAYGMTEASHQIASARIDATRPGAVGPASQNVDISLRHADGSRVASGDIGEVCVRGPNVIKEYIWPNDANATAFHGDWFRTGDLGTLAEDGQIKLTGRIKEQINRGGATLSPIDIEDAILQHPDVAEAVVFPLPHDTLGEEVAALVVPVLGRDISVTALQSQLSKALDFEHCPKFIFFAKGLPKQASSGKVSWTAIAKDYAIKAQTQADAPSAPAGTDGNTAQILQIASDILGRTNIAADTSLFACGLTSLDVFRLCTHVERTFGTRLAPTDVLSAPTCRALAQKINLKHSTPQDQIHTARAHVGPMLKAIAIRQNRSQPVMPNMATLVIDVPTSVTEQAILSAWGTVCAPHPMLRVKPNIAAENVTLGTATAPVVILRQTKTTLAKLQSDTDALLDLLAPQRKALVQPFLVTCGDGVRCLVVLIHQFIADGFAHHILVRQLNAVLAGQTLPNTDTHLELCHGDIDPQMAVPMDTIAPLNGFVSQIGLRLDFPLPQTDLVYRHGWRYAESCEAV
ncbi:MAG: AMP-binding protein [Tateyamaria sp.]|uniref:AMP-binding protein n=1 Tax=Tateyamaria sp. TaxID=1929288 RepID=UPI00329C9AAE